MAKNLRREAAALRREAHRWSDYGFEKIAALLRAAANRREDEAAELEEVAGAA